MNSKLVKAKNHIISQKRTYIILLSIILLGIISGIFFRFIISSNDKKLVNDSLIKFFNSIKLKDNLKFLNTFINSIINNLFYIILIWLLGISIIGIPLVIILLFFKSFIVGFSISSIIHLYGFKGILGALAYISINNILFLFILLLISFYSISFSIKLFKYLFLKVNINFKEVMNRYLRILIICLIGIFISSLIETFITSYLIKFFTLLLK